MKPQAALVEWIPARRALYEQIIRRCGITTDQAADAAQMPHAQAYADLQTLVEQALVRSPDMEQPAGVRRLYSF